MAMRNARTRSVPTSGVGRHQDGPPAPATVVTYRCDRDHRFTLRLAEDAVAPATWDCPRDGTTARLVDGAPEQAAPAGRPVRTPWDMLVERRSVAELESLLAERLSVLRARRGTVR